jgi:hypothetical protein
MSSSLTKPVIGGAIDARDKAASMTDFSSNTFKTLIKGQNPD